MASDHAGPCVQFQLAFQNEEESSEEKVDQASLWISLSSRRPRWPILLLCSSLTERSQAGQKLTHFTGGMGIADAAGGFDAIAQYGPRVVHSAQSCELLRGHEIGGHVRR